MMPTQPVMSEVQDPDLASREVELQGALDRETEMARRQQLLKELWRLSQQRELEAAEVCTTSAKC